MRADIEVAHKLGLWAGGEDTDENMIVLCHTCHVWQPDDDLCKLEVYLSDPLNPMQRFALDSIRLALHDMRQGVDLEKVLANFELACRLFNEFDSDEQVVKLLNLMGHR